MLYVIYAEENPKNLSIRIKYRSDHIMKWSRLKDEGRLILGGPFPAIDSEDPGEHGFIGAVIIAEFDSLEDANKFIQDDPFVINKVYENIKVTPFKRTL